MHFTGSQNHLFLSLIYWILGQKSIAISYIVDHYPLLTLIDHKNKSLFRIAIYFFMQHSISIWRDDFLDRDKIQ